ncbi:MAG: response regulator transcription factor [Chitinophagaceae bacterium]
MKRFLLADDHALIRFAIKNLLMDHFLDLQVEEVGDAIVLLDKVMKEKWDLVITDIDMPGPGALEVLPLIKQHSPALPVLVLSIHREELYAVRALKAGAAGFIGKDTVMEELIKAVHTALRGKKYIPPSIAERLVHTVENNPAAHPHENLSDRELGILRLIASGMTLSEIATELSLAVATISTYRSRILKKLNLKTNAALMQYAIAHRLL